MMLVVTSCTHRSLRRSMKKYLGTARKEVQAEKIMVLLVESGMMYLTIYVIISSLYLTHIG